MERVETQTWEEFVLELGKLEDTRSAIAKDSLPPSRILFRGQSSDEWSLETTLERRSNRDWSLAEYFRLISVGRPTLETFTERHWEVPDYPELWTWSKEYDNLKLTQFPGYDYLAYLRHNGFPSPLLDWTASPYVAAYFAFRKAHSGRVAIYAYMEYAGGGKVGSNTVPQIVTFGPYVTSHARHFLQQSQYTICAQYEENEWWYKPHEHVFDAGSITQDRLWKITIPATERAKVLRHLDTFNLNEFSLFRTDEALLETIAMREIDLRAGDA